MAGTEYFGQTAVHPRDHIPVNTMRKSHTFAGLIRLSTTTHNLLTFKMSEISSNNSKNSAYCQINTSGLFSYTRVIHVPGSVGPGQSSPAILLSPNSFDSWEPVPEAKDLVVTLEKRTMPYLSVSARIRVIDPFSQMKIDIIRYWTMQTLRIVITLSHRQSFTWCSPGNFSQGDQYLKNKLLNGTCPQTIFEDWCARRRQRERQKKQCD